MHEPPKHRPDDDAVDLNEAEMRWVRGRVRHSEHVKWLLRILRLTGGWFVATVAGALTVITLAKEIIKWVAGK